MSKLTSWMHDTINKMNVSPGLKDSLNTWVPFAFWAVIAAAGFILLLRVL